MILDQLMWVETEVPTIVDAPALSVAERRHTWTIASTLSREQLKRDDLG